MTTHEFLYQLWTLKMEISNKQTEVETLDTISTAIGSFEYDKDKVINSLPQGARFENIIIKKVDLRTTICEEIDHLMELWNRIHNFIELVPDDRERILLQQRYILGYSWDKIADTLSLSGDKSIYPIRRRALKHIEDVLIREGVEIDKTDYDHEPPQFDMPKRHRIAKEMLMEVSENGADYSNN